MPVTVTTMPALLSALKACKVAGAAVCAIVLAPGEWRDVTLQNVHAPARIGGPGAVLHDLHIVGSSDLTIVGLELIADAPVSPAGAALTNNFFVSKSQHITLSSLRVRGASTQTLATAESGFLIRGNDDVTVEDSDFSGLHNALGQLQNTHLTIRRNKFHDLWDDAIRGGDSSWVTIDGNFCYSNHPDKSDPDHPDCFQNWTSNTSVAQHDFLIVNNHYERGSGNGTQFIFMGNEARIPYENVVIRNNTAFGSGTNGIAITVAKNVEIGGNKLIPSCAPETDGKVQSVSRIMTGGVSGLTMVGNSSSQIGSRGGDTLVKSHGNTTSPCLNKPPRNPDTDEGLVRH